MPSNNTDVTCGFPTNRMTSLKHMNAHFPPSNPRLMRFPHAERTHMLLHMYKRTPWSRVQTVVMRSCTCRPCSHLSSHAHMHGVLAPSNTRLLELMHMHAAVHMLLHLHRCTECLHLQTLNTHTPSHARSHVHGGRTFTCSFTCTWWSHLRTRGCSARSRLQWRCPPRFWHGAHSSLA